MREIFFRVDFGHGIGLGHLSRCKNIAEAFTNAGFEPVFLFRSHEGIDLARIGNYKFKVLGKGHSCLPDDSSNWLGVPLDQDAKDTLAILTNPEKSLVLVDHYSINSTWHTYLRQHGATVVTLDDFVIREHSSDYLIDYNFGASKEKYQYQGKFLGGPAYFPASLNMAESKKEITSNKIKTCLIYLGSCDPGLIEKLLLAIKQSGLSEKIESFSLIHPQKPHSIFPNIRHLSFSENMVKEVLQHDIVIGACGVSFLERCLLKCFQLNFKISDNQQSNSDHLEKTFPQAYGGDLRELSLIDLVQRLSKLLNCSSKDMVPVYPELDGDGANRIVKELLFV